MITIRAIAVVVALLLALMTGEAVAQDGRQDLLRVTLLGTGAPDPLAERFSASTLIEAGARRILIDAGRGATIRLNQIGVPLGSIDTVFLTHYHSDHTVGLPDLWLTGWLPPSFGQRKSPLNIVGPVGAAELVAGLQRAFADDIRIRRADQKLTADGASIHVKEFDSDGVVYDEDGLRVTAFAVDHGDAVKPAFGYRIDYAGRSVLLSGDTRVNENVVRYGTGVDMMVHEVFAVAPDLLNVPAVQLIAAHHVTPQQGGTVFSRAKPKLAVFTHLSTISTPSTPAVTTQDIVARTRETYGGPLVVGEDLMAFDIGALGIAIYRRTAR